MRYKRIKYRHSSLKYFCLSSFHFYFSWTEAGRYYRGYRVPQLTGSNSSKLDNASAGADPSRKLWLLCRVQSTPYTLTYAHMYSVIPFGRRDPAASGLFYPSSSATWPALSSIHRGLWDILRLSVSERTYTLSTTSYNITEKLVILLCFLPSIGSLFRNSPMYSDYLVILFKIFYAFFFHIDF